MENWKLDQNKGLARSLDKGEETNFRVETPADPMLAHDSE